VLRSACCWPSPEFVESSPYRHILLL
jgi:hypothetical protein